MDLIAGLIGFGLGIFYMAAFTIIDVEYTFYLTHYKEQLTFLEYLRRSI